MTLVYPLQSLDAHPPRLSPGYKSTVKRSPTKPLIPMRHTLSELTGPVYGHETVRENDNDHTLQHKGEPLGERIIVHGHVLDEDGRGVPNTLVELWQANACGRYIHVVDQHPAPLDPNFTGAGRARSDADGYYRFITVKPGAYPWGNHHNAWRPAHIHFSVFGHAFVSRLVTQMYFPGDPLFPFDPIFNSVTDEKARMRMVSSFDLDNTQPDWALCFRFNIVLRGRNATPTCRKRNYSIADRRAVLQIWPDAGRQIRLERRLHQQPGHPGHFGRAHQGRRPGARRRRAAGRRLHAGDLAG